MVVRYGSHQNCPEIYSAAVVSRGCGVERRVRARLAPGGEPLLDEPPVDRALFHHHPTHAEPRMLGFECHRVLRDRWGKTQIAFRLDLAADIQDRDDNQTRFYAVAREDAAVRSASAGERWKTAVVLETRNRPGALVAVLRVFAGHGINLTKLESRPGAEPWSYRFILELVSADPGAESASMVEAAAAAVNLRVLGRFRPWAPDE